MVIPPDPARGCGNPVRQPMRTTNRVKSDTSLRETAPEENPLSGGRRDRTGGGRVNRTQQDLVVALAAQRVPLHEIAAAVGVSRNAIYAEARRDTGFADRWDAVRYRQPPRVYRGRPGPPRVLSPADQRVICAQIAQGMSVRAAAAAVGVSDRTVHREMGRDTGFAALVVAARVSRQPVRQAHRARRRGRADRRVPTNPRTAENTPAE